MKIQAWLMVVRSVAGCATSAAQPYPVRPVRVIVTYPAGGSSGS